MSDGRETGVHGGEQDDGYSSWSQGFEEGYRARSREAVDDKLELQAKVHDLQHKLIVALDAITHRDAMIQFLREVVTRARGETDTNSG